MEKLTVYDGTLRFLFDALRSRYVMSMTSGDYAAMARRLGAPEEVTCDRDANPSIVDPEADWYVKYCEFIGFWRLFYHIPDAKERAEMEAIYREICARGGEAEPQRKKIKVKKKRNS